jgi:NADH-quinone oxidoreductase subunit H
VNVPDPYFSATTGQPAPVLQALIGQPPAGWMILLWDVTLVMFVFLGLVSVVGFIGIWAERKVAGRIQHRHGPNRVGPVGLLQSLADGIKLVSKEDLTPTRADRRLFFLAPYLAFAPVFAAFMALPFGPDFIFDRTLSVSLLWVLAILGVEVIGVILAGWSSNNKWSVYGGMREACQLISYEIPLGLSMLVVVLAVGTLDLLKLSALQADGLQHWLVFRQPFIALAFVLFFIASLASNKRAPFDLPESDSELVAGYHTEYSGLRFSLFYLAEYNAMFVMSGVMAVLFLGSWADPFGLIARGYVRSRDAGDRWTPLLWNAAAAGVFTTKCAALMFVQMWVRWTLPRPRIDQVLHVCVKVMVPASLALLLGSAIWELLVRNGSIVERATRLILAAGGVAIMVAMAGLIVAAFLGGRQNQQRLFSVRPAGGG